MPLHSRFQRFYLTWLQHTDKWIQVVYANKKNNLSFFIGMLMNLLQKCTILLKIWSKLQLQLVCPRSKNKSLILDLKSSRRLQTLKWAWGRGMIALLWKKLGSTLELIFPKPIGNSKMFVVLPCATPHSIKLTNLQNKSIMILLIWNKTFWPASKTWAGAHNTPDPPLMAPEPERSDHLATINATIATNTEMLRLMQQLQQQMRTMQATSTPLAHEPPPSRNGRHSFRHRRNTSKYCWTHGACSHEGGDCNAKAQGH